MTTDTMTVRVIDRGTSRSYEGLRIRQVNISAYCLKDGQRRGEPRGHHFSEDGEWYTCDRWTNPCGHVDMYDDVLVEAGVRKASA
jgi:hypothetical protein